MLTPRVDPPGWRPLRGRCSASQLLRSHAPQLRLSLLRNDTSQQRQHRPITPLRGGWAGSVDKALGVSAPHFNGSSRAAERGAWCGKGMRLTQTDPDTKKRLKAGKHLFNLLNRGRTGVLRASWASGGGASRTSERCVGHRGPRRCGVCTV